MHTPIRNMWQSKNLLTILLVPLSWLFFVVITLRRWLLTRRLKTIPKPVIVVGNITTGGTGKTSFVWWLCRQLKQNQLKPGIILRGYKANPPAQPFPITSHTPPVYSGDEAKLLQAKCACPVVIGKNRRQAAQYLCDHHNIDIVISDDGLQHYQLPRAMEIIMINSLYNFGNQQLLPAGPLREPLSRLQEATYIITTQSPQYDRYPDSLHLHHRPTGWLHLKSNSQHDLEPIPFPKEHLLAITATGNPEGFFQNLTKLKLSISTQILMDHSTIPQTLLTPHKGIIIITEKDAHRLSYTPPDHLWCLLITPILTPSVSAQKLVKSIKKLTQHA